jgi:hypothetical protein
MQYNQIPPDSSSIANSKRFISEIATVTETQISDSNIPVKTVKLFFNMPLELATIIIPVLITIILFIVGYFINWVLIKYNKKRKLESIKATVTNWIKLIEKPIEEQITYCNEFAENLRNSEDLQPESLSLVQLHVSKLKELNLKELTETFITNQNGTESENSKNVFNLVSQIEYFTHTELKLPNAYDVYQKHTFELMKSWNKSLLELDQFKGSIIQEIGTKPTHISYPLLVEINNITNAYVRNHPKDKFLNYTKVELLDKLHSLADRVITQNSNDTYAPILFTKVQELILIYKRKVAHFEGNAKNFDIFSINMKKSFDNLKTTSQKIKEAKFKRVLFLK